MEIASLMMMSPMIVWGRKREEEYPHQYMVHTCTPRDSTTITDSGRNGGEQEERTSFFYPLALRIGMM